MSEEVTGEESSTKKVSPVEGENLDDGHSALQAEPVEGSSVSEEPEAEMAPSEVPADDTQTKGEIETVGEQEDEATETEKEGELTTEASTTDAPPAEAQTEEKVCQESVKQMREIDEETLIAQTHGWHRLGRGHIEIKRSLPDQEIAVIAKAQAKILMEIDDLEKEKKKVAAEFKDQIDELQASAIESAKRIQRGEVLDNIYLPYFLDVQSKERVWFDPKKNEVVKREPAKLGDLQGKLFEKEKTPELSVIEGGAGKESKPLADVIPIKKDEASNEAEKPNIEEVAASSETSNEVEKEEEVVGNCENCGGYGAVNMGAGHEDETCLSCDGTGFAKPPTPLVPRDPEKVPCQNCDGTGHVENDEQGTAEACFRCNGSGEVFGPALAADPEKVLSSQPMPVENEVPAE